MILLAVSLFASSYSARCPIQLRTTLVNQVESVVESLSESQYSVIILVKFNVSPYTENLVIHKSFYSEHGRIKLSF